jgi:hypothetical protein
MNSLISDIFFFKEWNTLPNSIKTINDHDEFKSAVKEHREK